MRKTTLLIATIIAAMSINSSHAAKFAWGKPMKIKEVTPQDRICFAMYTLNNNTLKLFTQTYCGMTKAAKYIWKSKKTGCGRESPKQLSVKTPTASGTAKPGMLSSVLTIGTPPKTPPIAWLHLMA